MEKLQVELPTEIKTIINSNIKQFALTVYVEEESLGMTLLEYLESGSNKESAHYDLKFKCTEIINTKNFSLSKIDLNKIPYNSKSSEIGGFFFIIHDYLKKVYFIITPENKEFLDKVVHVFMKDYFYNKISRVYLTSKDIYDVLSRLKDKLKRPIMTKWCTGKRLFSENPETVSKWGNKFIPFEKCFEIAKHEKMTINWIRVRCFDDKENYLLNLDISREGNIVSNLKFIEQIYGIISIVLKKGSDDLKLLQGKEIKKDTPAIPILLEYKEEILTNKEIKEKLIDTINNYEHCNYSVIHGGNPHIYMYIRDAIDFSSFSLRSLGTKKILLIPQLKSTYSALIRFIHFLNEHFTEYENILEIKDA